MPVFYRPARVVIDEGGGGRVALAVVLLAALGAVVDAVSAVLATVLTAVLVSLVLLAGAGTAAFILAERRFRPGGLRSPQQAAPAGDVQSPALGAGSPAAIEGKHPATVLGFVLDNEEARR